MPLMSVRLVSGFLTICLLSSCYGLTPQPAELFELDHVSHASKALHAQSRLALISTDGQRLSPPTTALQQNGLLKMHHLLQAQGLNIGAPVPASGVGSKLEQGFPELVAEDTLGRLKQTAQDQQADLIVLIKQTARPDQRVDLFSRQVKFNCEVALQVYSPSEQAYLMQVKANGENGYNSLLQSAALIGMISTTLVTPGIRLGYGAAQQQQGTQVSTIAQLIAGGAIVGILAWDISQGVTTPETRQQAACDQALQQAATGLSRGFGLQPAVEPTR